MDFGKNWKMLLKTSNGTGFKLFTLNQVIDENNQVLLSLVYFVKVIHQRELIEKGYLHLCPRMNFL